MKEKSEFIKIDTSYFIKYTKWDMGLKETQYLKRINECTLLDRKQKNEAT
jgi:hypothetical protein